MSIKYLLRIAIIFSSIASFSQDHLYSSFTIPDDLRQHANAVIRLSEVDISMASSSEMTIAKKCIITVLNKEGNDNVNAYVHYDNDVKIKALQALAFDAMGNEIKKIKKNDFKDVSAVPGGTLYSDSRVKYMEYTPIKYPYTIEFTYETVTGNTAFIPSFMPIQEYFVSVENSSYTISYPEGITIRKKEKNFSGSKLKKDESPGRIFYEANNLEAFKPESYSPSFTNFTPKVLFASKQFTLEGVTSEVENWNDFGKWMYHDLIKDTYDLPASTIAMIKDLVKDEVDDISKAKKIYEYVQGKTRYISVQVGIGGWKPYNASEVDKLGYGDCKALTNYTMSLLKAAGIKSNYSVVYAGSSQKNIEEDFTSIQGNHVILNIPAGNDDHIWLECTSQKLPFGFIGDFTDDRDVLVITPEGGKIEHTKKYTTDENTQILKGQYAISNDGIIEASLDVVSKGIQYDDKYGLATESERDLNMHYKDRWSYINNITIDKISLNNDKDNIAFREDLKFAASGYPKMVANRMLLTVNALNRNTYVPDRYRSRTLPLKIKRGFIDVDEVEIKLPSDYKVESLPGKKTIENKFGSYSCEVVVKDENTLIYKRSFLVNDGEFPKEDYSEFRNFYKEVAKQDNSKIALIKNQL